ncbi:hypothetical protein [Tomitella gaofuii]|uniref:hypothetical protein n=1 Tax=Tomitella gaofuii TaxID=2760083 RepID=UPI0015F9B7FA|nr:hypothetical protein [Tomitella gaofuii]
MSTEHAADAAHSPPFPPAVVAALHADLCEHDEAPGTRPPGPGAAPSTAGPDTPDHLRAPHEAVLADPEAARLLGDLDEVRARLATAISWTAAPSGERDHGPRTAGPSAAAERPYAVAAGAAADGTVRDEAMPDEPMPELVAARLRRALVAESAPGSAPPAPVGASSLVDPAAARTSAPRGRRMLAAAAAVAAIGAAVGGSAFWLTAGPDVTTGAVAAHSAPAAGTAVPRDIAADGLANDSSVDAPADHAGERPGGASVDGGALLQMQGRTDLGPFADPAVLRRCLAANGLPAGARILGSGPVHVDGHKGTLLLVPGPRPPMLTGLVVTAQCGVNGDGLLFRTDLGAP